jgi:3'-phosphoadenosine 5'-phosphosulfate sulfotransferase (PAPS reductase)/FAD synthetase
MFEKFKSPTLLFSAGKDSLATLLTLRPHWSEISVVWSNAGASPAAVIEYMGKIAERVPNFVELRGDQPSWVSAHGWPADVVPVESTVEMHGAEQRPLTFAPRTACCGANLWAPMRRYRAETGCTLVITGQRQAEGLRNRLRDAEFSERDGVTYWSPLNAWSDADVYAYLQEQGEPLPPGYAEGATSSVDCWNCTAYLEHNAGRYAAMRRDAPEQWAQVAPVLRELGDRLRVESKPLFDLIGT